MNVLNLLEVINKPHDEGRCNETGVSVDNAVSGSSSQIVRVTTNKRIELGLSSETATVATEVSTGR